MDGATLCCDLKRTCAANKAYLCRAVAIANHQQGTPAEAERQDRSSRCIREDDWGVQSLFTQYGANIRAQSLGYLPGGGGSKIPVMPLINDVDPLRLKISGNDIEALSPVQEPNRSPTIHHLRFESLDLFITELWARHFQSFLFQMEGAIGCRQTESPAWVRKRIFSAEETLHTGLELDGSGVRPVEVGVEMKKRSVIGSDFQDVTG
jgi:hypothetical protein